MANFAQNLLSGMALGRERRLQDEAIAKQNRLGQLAGDAFAAAPDQRGGILAEVARLDPQSAFAMQGTFDAQAQRAEAGQQAKLGNMAKLLSVAPAQARGGLYARMRPGLQAMGFDAPEQWSDDLLPVVQSLGGVQGDNFRPMVVAPGSALVGPDGRVVFQNAFKPEAPDRGQIVNVPVEGGTQAMVWRDGQLQPLQGPAPATPSRRPTGGTGAPNMDAILTQANIMAQQGVPDAQIEEFIARRAGEQGVQVTPVSGTAPPAAPSGGRLGFRPDAPTERLASPAELRQLGYAESDIVSIDANGVPKPIRVAEAPGAKPPSADTANKVSLYDNALRAANEWRSLVVSSDGSFNDIAARTPQARALLDQALRAKLRAESGASISSEEIAGETGRYMGGLFSSDATAVQQANALIEDLTNQRAALDPSGQIQPVIPVGGSQQPSSPPPAAGGIRIISVTPAGQR